MLVREIAASHAESSSAHVCLFGVTTAAACVLIHQRSLFSLPTGTVALGFSHAAPPKMSIWPSIWTGGFSIRIALARCAGSDMRHDASRE